MQRVKKKISVTCLWGPRGMGNTVSDKYTHIQEFLSARIPAVGWSNSPAPAWLLAVHGTQVLWCWECPRLLPRLFTFYRAACNADAVLWWDFCLSVRPSVCHTRDLWQNGRKICPNFKPYERTFILVFWEEKWLVGGDPFYVKFWVNRPPFERNRRFLTNNRS